MEVRLSVFCAVTLLLTYPNDFHNALSLTELFGSCEWKAVAYFIGSILDSLGCLKYLSYIVAPSQEAGYCQTWG